MRSSSSSSSRDEVMATVSFHPQSLSEEEVDMHKGELARFFSEGGAGEGAGVTSLHFQVRKAHGHGRLSKLVHQ